MRINQKKKNGYLPAFQYLDGVTVEPELADKWVQAPPEALFMYHTWKRLLGGYYFSRNIPQRMFLEFLSQDEQWDPKYWVQAPDAYVELVQWIKEGNTYDNLNLLNDREMPIMVRQAFQGWRNYTHEGDAINRVDPSYSELNFFLSEFPNYSRPFWKNVLEEKQPNYLLSEGLRGPDKVPSNELSPFLKTGIYNFFQSSANPRS